MSARINTHSELVFNVLRYATRMLQQGDESALLLMGFEAEDVRAVEGLTVKHLQRMSELGASFMDFRIDHGALRKVVLRLKDERSIEELKDELLLAGAPQALMHHYWGMTSRDCSARRRVLGVVTSIGRPRRLPEEALEQLWHLWAALDSIDDERERYLELARRSGHSLAAIWPVVEGWKALREKQATVQSRRSLEVGGSRRLSASFGAHRPESTAQRAVSPS